MREGVILVTRVTIAVITLISGVILAIPLAGSRGVSHPTIKEHAPVVAYLDEKVKVYRYDNGVDRCYVAVAYLHGWNIDVECKFGEGRVHE